VLQIPFPRREIIGAVGAWYPRMVWRAPIGSLAPAVTRDVGSLMVSIVGRTPGDGLRDTVRPIDASLMTNAIQG